MSLRIENVQNNLEFADLPNWIQGQNLKELGLELQVDKYLPKIWYFSTMEDSPSTVVNNKA